MTWTCIVQDRLITKHLPDSILQETATFLKTKEGSNFFSFTRPLMELLKTAYDIYLVTGEVQCVGRAVAEYFFVRGYVSSEVEVENGVYTGTILKSLATKEGKRDAIHHIFQAYPYEDSLAFGDSECQAFLKLDKSAIFCASSLVPHKRGLIFFYAVEIGKEISLFSIPTATATT